MQPFDVAVLGQICFVIVMTVGSLTGIGIVAHAYLQRGKRKTTPPMPIDDERFDRLEHSIEAIAIEVERISEGQRFLTKLQSSGDGGSGIRGEGLRPEGFRG